MGLVYWLTRKLVRIACLTLLFSAFIVLIPNLPPYTKFTSIQLEPTQERVGPLEPNGALNNAEKFVEGRLSGPEAFAVHKGDIYTSLQTGEIVKISPGGQVAFVTKIGQPCRDIKHPELCGRPLGITIDEKNNILYVVDAYFGIWKVDLRNDKKQLLVSPRVEIEGRKPMLFNSIALAKNGDLYWTDSTSDFPLHDGAYSFMADPSGRLFQYIPAKNQSKVLLDNLWFPNGVVLSPDNKFVVVAESCKYRLTKYYIDGPKKGKSEVFAAGLPGVPDNLQVLPDGSGLIASMYVSFDEKNPLIARSMAEIPIVRKLVARVLRLVEIPFEFLSGFFKQGPIDDVVFGIGHFKSFELFSPGIAGVLQIDWNGKIIASYYNYDGTLKSISDVIVVNDKLYTGTPHGQDFIGVVPAPPLLKKAFASVKTAPPPKTAETVTKEVPKPKIETPKPTTEKPKVELKKEAPKPKVEVKKEAPKAQAQPKPTKPVESVKVKPAEPIPATPKPTAAPQTTTPEPPTVKKTEEKTKPTTPKVEPKSAPTPKVEPKTPQAEAEKETTKPATPKPAAEKKPSETTKRAKEQREIPIKEDIPSDTVKPNKETLKVIKKGGPTEIPNPHL